MLNKFENYKYVMHLVKKKVMKYLGKYKIQVAMV